MNSDFNPNSLRTELQSWARTVKTHSDVGSAYVFGSLIYRDGERFEASHSDVDLLLILGEKSNADPLSRVETLKRLAPIKENLETVLQKALQRRGDLPISSVVVVTDWEVALSIHKDRSPTFFSDTDFLDLLATSEKKSPLSEPLEERISLSEALAAIQGAQKLRNQFLAIAANGSRMAPPSSGYDPLPKDLLRAAAQLAYSSTPGLTPETKFDINRGLLFMVELVGQHVPELREDISKRIGGRGSLPELTWEILMFYWEVLAQRASKVLRTPLRHPLDELREQAILSGTFHLIDPWVEAGSAEELEFKREFKGKIALANQLFDAGDLRGVVKCWAPIQDNPHFDPSHHAWVGRPLFILLIQGALIDLSYAHMQLLPGEGSIKENLLGAYESARRVLSVPPYSMKGPSKSSLTIEDAEYGNGCYANFINNATRFTQSWSPDVAMAFGVDSSLAKSVEMVLPQRKYEVEFILRRAP